MKNEIWIMPTKKDGNVKWLEIEAYSEACFAEKEVKQEAVRVSVETSTRKGAEEVYVN